MLKILSTISVKNTIFKIAFALHEEEQFNLVLKNELPTKFDT